MRASFYILLVLSFFLVSNTCDRGESGADSGGQVVIAQRGTTRGTSGTQSSSLSADAGDTITVTAGDAVTFDGSRSRGNIQRYRWEFGDHAYFDKAGTAFEAELRAVKPGEGARPKKTYWREGTYTVTLTVFDSSGRSDSDTVTVTVKPNKSPEARINVSAEDSRSGLALFDASPTSDPEGDAVSFQWNLSDGTAASERKVQHKYDLSRIKSDIGDCTVEYQAILKATDSHSASDRASTWVEFATSSEAASQKARLTPPFDNDLAVSLNIQGGRLRVEETPRGLDLYVGERVFIPVKISNADSRGYNLELTRVAPRNTNVRLVGSEIPANQTATLGMEVQTLNVYNHKLELKLSLGESSQNFSVPVKAKVKPLTPLFGGYAHFYRHAAPDIIGDAYLQMGKAEKVSVGEKKASEDMQYMRDYPIQVYRVTSVGQWHVVQMKGPNDYEWRLLDWEIEQAMKAGARVIVTLCTGPPSWVKRYDFTNDPRAAAAYRTFVEKLVDRCRGKVDYYELSNEPIAFWLRKSLGQKAVSELRKDRKAMRRELENFARVLIKTAQISHEVINARDPAAILTTPGFETVFRKTWPDKAPFFQMWEYLFKGGIQRYCQRVGVHNFPFGYNDEPPQLNDLANWRKLDENADSGELITLMKKYNIPLGVWLTEIGGWRNSDATEVNQAMAMLRTTAIIAHQHGEGILTVGLYDYPTDDSPYVYLMKHENHHKTYGFYAYQQLISSLCGATPYESGKIRNSSIVGATYGSVVPKLFNRGNEDILCLWNNSSSSEKVTLKLAGGFRKSQLFEITETGFSARGEFYSQRRYSGFADSGDSLSFTLQPLDFRVIQVVSPRPQFDWLAALTY